MQYLILAGVGAFLGVFCLLFMFLSNFGCQTGNVGSAGLQGVMGDKGPMGFGGQVALAFDPDLRSHNLTSGDGYVQQSFPGNVLSNHENGLVISTWVVSVYSPSTLTHFQFAIRNIATNTDITLSPAGTMNLTYNNVPVNRRHEVMFRVYIWRTSTDTLQIACEGQLGLVSATLGALDDTELGVRLHATPEANLQVITRQNSIIVYKDVNVTESWCV